MVSSNKFSDSRRQSTMSEELKTKLKIFKIPEEDWYYLLTHPQQWDFSITSSSGLSKGVEVLFTTNVYCMPNWIQKNQFLQIGSKLREMMYAEEDAERFENRVDKACNSKDFFFIIYLLGADEDADRVKKRLTKAYDDLEDACHDSNREELSELITSNLLSYMDSKATRVQAVNNSLQNLKNQINIRGLLDPPKFRSGQHLGLNEEQWDHITAAATT